MKKFAAGTEKSRDAVRAVLADVLIDQVVLEVGAGTGQHAVYLARELPSVTWIPSEVDEEQIDSIAAWRREAALPNLRAPLKLDVTAADWDIPPVGAIVAIDVVGRAPWAVCVSLLNGAARHLPARGLLVLHGDLPEETLALAKRRGFALERTVDRTTVLRFLPQQVH